MIHQLSVRIASCFMRHDLIDQQRLPHLQYKTEMLLHSLSFVLCLALLALWTGRWGEIALFAVPTCLLRRRMGGWHAPSPGLCFVMSLGIVVLSVFFLGPLLLRLSMTVCTLLCLLLDAFALYLGPAYPPQMNFNAAELRANTRRTKLLLCLLPIVQIIAFFRSCRTVLAYTFLSLAVTVMTVLLEKIKQKKGVTSHEIPEIHR